MSGRGWALLASTAGVVLVAVCLGAIGRPLITSAAPQGIVSFEFAGNAERTAAILDSWNHDARESAMLSLGLDYLFLLLYPLWLALAVDSLGRRFGDGEGRAARAARGLAWLVLLAAPLDALENLALIRALQSGPSTVWAQTAWLCALPKFALVGAATSYLAGAGTVLLARRLRTT